jgi:hypothetical protein
LSARVVLISLFITLFFSSQPWPMNEYAINQLITLAPASCKAKSDRCGVFLSTWCVRALNEPCFAFLWGFRLLNIKNLQGGCAPAVIRFGARALAAASPPLAKANF